MRNVFARAVVVGGVGLIIVGSSPSPAGTIRHDVPDSSYTALAANPQAAPVGLLRVFGDVRGGTLFRTDPSQPTSRYVLTAAHNVLNVPVMELVFTVGGTDYTVEQTFVPDGYAASGGTRDDIAVVRLTQAPANVTPANLFTGNDEAGDTGFAVGFGKTGTGVTGVIDGTQGTKRAGTNVIDRYGVPSGDGNISVTVDDGADRTLLLTDFDDPRSTANNVFGSATPTVLEFQIADKDSGSALFVQDAGGFALAGVAVSIADPLGTTGTVSNDSTYGDLSIFTRVTAYQSFINGAVPEPGGAALFLAAAVPALARRRRR